MNKKIDLTKLKLNGVSVSERDGKYFATINTSGVSCTYDIAPDEFERPAQAILMDLDGTSVMSEEFWVYLIEKTIKTLLSDDNFRLTKKDAPFVSGYSTMQHLQYCIDNYCKGKSLAEANSLYHKIAEYELNEILQGRGNIDAFKPRKYLKEFLTEVKARGIKIGLVTSGLEYKAIPEIVAVFRQLDMGDPLDFYDAIICGGKRKTKGQYGTIGEMAVKPHPWLYSEIGMVLSGENRRGTVALEDTSSGVISAVTAGYNVIGMNDGNLHQSGTNQFCLATCDDLLQVLQLLK